MEKIVERGWSVGEKQRFLFLSFFFFLTLSSRFLFLGFFSRAKVSRNKRTRRSHEANETLNNSSFVAPKVRGNNAERESGTETKLLFSFACSFSLFVLSSFVPSHLPPTFLEK